MRRAARIDATQPAIVDALERIGATVQSLAAVGNGCPDILVGFRGRNVAMEVKTSTGRMRPEQVKWLRAWRGEAHVVRSVEDALRALEVVR